MSAPFAPRVLSSPAQLAAARAQAARVFGVAQCLLALPAPGRDPAARARWVALAALADAVPNLNMAATARALGVVGHAGARLRDHIQTARWWRDEWVETVAAAIPKESLA